ncbi:uncharacterized protein LOC119388027 [Rhipicephalus sanguineus]|uniref:uncharacterized protein LOC119388027 n=1 Tax=Rhipicephalus sanguineus TaxID=34632 RepID=UPI001893BB77|nr:uncharacterized protein LOC119388027 [Rhipicephalus sanguineus]
MKSQILAMFWGILCAENLMCEPQAAPYSGQPSPLLSDSQQSPVMRELAKAHAEQLARAEESIADLVRQLKALPPDDARKEQLAAQLRQQQQALREMRDKFRDQLLCVLTHDAANNGTLADDKDAQEAVLLQCTGAISPAAGVDTTQTQVNETAKR